MTDKLSLFQDNELSYSVPHRVNCRTVAIKRFLLFAYFLAELNSKPSLQN